MKLACFSIWAFWHSASPDKIRLIVFWIVIISVGPKHDKTLLTAVPHASCANGPSKSVFHACALWLNWDVFMGLNLSIKLWYRSRTELINCCKIYFKLILPGIAISESFFSSWISLIQFNLLIAGIPNGFLIFLGIVVCSFTHRKLLFDSYRGCKF